MISKRSWRLAGALFLAVTSALCGRAADDAVVTIITPHTEAIRFEFARGFARWHEKTAGRPARVEWRDLGGTSDAIKFVQSEFARKPEGIGIDCFFGGGLEPFLLLSDRKLVLPYRPPEAIMSGIPHDLNGMEIYDRQGAWHGVVLSSFGILQNTRVFRLLKLPPAERWEELAQPALRGWVGAGDPRNSGTMNVMFEAFLQAFGWERGWAVLARVGGNARKFDRISSATAKDVTLGETACGFAIDFYGFTQVAAAGRTNLSFVLPGDFAAVNPDCLCILKGAPQAETARRFVDFALSEDGQKLWFLPRGHPEGPQQFSIERMSVRPEFYRRYKGVSNVEFSPFDLKQKFRYDAKLGRDRREIVAALVGAALVDTHAELQAAWRAVIRRGLLGSDVAELGRMPISEAEGLELARTRWKDPAQRNRIKLEWQQWALEKYRRLQKDAPPGSR